MNRSASALKLKYIIAFHFEATCDAIQDRIPYRKTEIIEFTAVLLNLENGEILSEFHKFCRPVEKPILSAFCLKLTNIEQNQVNQADDLQHVLHEFNEWLLKLITDYNMILPKTSTSINCAFLTWTNFDINFFLASECERKNIILENYFHEWINLKNLFRGRYNMDERQCTFENAMKLMKINFEGNQHSELDDSRNLAKFAYQMLQNGINFKLNGVIKDEKRF